MKPLEKLPNDTTEHLNLMLPFLVKVTSMSRKVVDGYFIKYYTVRLEFRNITAEFDIYEDDPRYETIEQHLKGKNIFKEESQ